MEALAERKKTLYQKLSTPHSKLLALSALFGQCVHHSENLVLDNIAVEGIADIIDGIQNELFDIMSDLPFESAEEDDVDG